MDEFPDFPRWCLEVRGLALKTTKEYGFKVRGAQRAFNGKLDTASLPLLKRYLFSTKPTARTRNQVRCSLVAYFDYLIDAGIRKTNPARGLTRLPEKRSLPKPIRRSAVQTLLEEAENYSPLFGCLVTVLVYTGLRITEVLSLQWKQLDEDSKVVLRQKGGTERMVFLNAPARAALRKWEALCPSSRWVFSSPLGDFPVSYSWARRKIRDIGADAGLEDIHPHRLRHTFGTTLYEETGDIMIVKTALGHKNIQSTMIYTEVSATRVQRAVARLTY